jgi:hypothetical protein
MSQTTKMAVNGATMSQPRPQSPAISGPIYRSAVAPLHKAHACQHDPPSLSKARPKPEERLFAGFVRQVHHNAARRQIDIGHDCRGKGQKQGRFVTDGRYFDDIPRPMVVNRADLADQLSPGVIGRKADQVGMVELVIRQRGQPVAGNEEAGAAQGIGLFLGRDTLDPRAEAA